MQRHREFPRHRDEQKKTKRNEQIPTSRMVRVAPVSLCEAPEVPAAEHHIHQEYDHSPVALGRPTVVSYVSTAAVNFGLTQRLELAPWQSATPNIA